jgi:surfeit locus 1 family protein
MSAVARFKLRKWLPHLAAILVLLGCARLMLWQLDRAEEKQALLNQWEAAPTASLDDEQLADYTPVTGTGRFDSRRHVLLDNQVRNNHPGVHVFTPFHPDNSDRIILVNRGWQPFDRRSGQWPEFETGTATIELSGRISPPPRVGLQIGRAEPLDSEHWPNLMTYFDLEHLQDVFGPRLYEKVMLLDSDHPAHLTGDPWRPVTMGPERHQGYAFQWASIGFVVFLIWVILTIRALRK